MTGKIKILLTLFSQSSRRGWKYVRKYLWKVSNLLQTKGNVSVRTNTSCEVNVIIPILNVSPKEPP